MTSNSPKHAGSSMMHTYANKAATQIKRHHSRHPSSKRYQVKNNFEGKRFSLPPTMSNQQYLSAATSPVAASKLSMSHLKAKSTNLME